MDNPLYEPQLRLPSILPTLVALTAPAMGSGKSEVAKVFQEHSYVLVKFAAPLKDMTRVFLRALGEDDETVERMVEGDLKERVISSLGTTPRRVMQTLGTEWGRDHVRSDLWVHIFTSRVRQEMAKGRSVICDDMRFYNEAQAVFALNGTTIRIVRPSAKITSDHASEDALKGIEMNFRIINDGSLHELREKARALLTNYI